MYSDVISFINYSNVTWLQVMVVEACELYLVRRATWEAAKEVRGPRPDTLLAPSQNNVTFYTSVYVFPISLCY